MDNFVSNKKKYFLLSLIAILLIGNFYFILKSNSLSRQISQKQTEASYKNESTIEFLALFVEKVLKSEKEVDFDTRLALENSVRATGDRELIEQWQKFTNSQTEESAQIEVKNLLGMIASKIK